MNSHISSIGVEIITDSRAVDLHCQIWLELIFGDRAAITLMVIFTHKFGSSNDRDMRGELRVWRESFTSRPARRYRHVSAIGVLPPFAWIGLTCRAMCNPSNRHSPPSWASPLFLHLVLISAPHTALMHITGEGARWASWRSKAVRLGLLPWRTRPTATHACPASAPRRSRHDETVGGKLCTHTEGRSLHRRCATAKTRRNAHR
jgi:hypothetical protein